jgi:hypothetical protein
MDNVDFEAMPAHSKKVSFKQRTNNSTDLLSDQEIVERKESESEELEKSQDSSLADHNEPRSLRSIDDNLKQETLDSVNVIGNQNNNPSSDNQILSPEDKNEKTHVEMSPERKIIEIKQNSTEDLVKEPTPIKEDIELSEDQSSVKQREWLELYNKILNNLRHLFDEYTKLEGFTIKANSGHLCDSDFETEKYMKLKDFLLFCKDHSIVTEEDPVTKSKDLSTLFKLICTSQGLNFEKFLTLMRHIATTIDDSPANSDLLAAVDLLSSQAPGKRSLDSSSDLHRSSVRSILKSSTDFKFKDRLKQRMTLTESKEKIVDQKSIIKKHFEKSMSEIPEFREDPSIHRIPINSANDYNASMVLRVPQKANYASTIASNNPEILPVDKSTHNFINYFVNREFHNITQARKRSFSLNSKVSVYNNYSYDRSQSRQSTNPRATFSTQNSNPISKNVTEKSPAQTVFRKNAFNCSRLAIPLREPIDKQKSLKKVSLARNNRILQHLSAKKNTNKDSIDYDSYHLREQQKVKSNFLKNFSWQTIDKMKVQDLEFQMNEKIVSDRVLNIKQAGINKYTGGNPNERKRAQQKIYTKENIDKIISYGKTFK